MKTRLLMLLALAGLSSCSNNLLEDLNVANTQDTNQTMSLTLNSGINEPAIVKDLRNYVSLINSRCAGSQARSAADYTLTPFVYQGDTVMYIANYGNGWELLSTDHRVPLVIASSDTGEFAPNDTTNMNPAILAYISSVADELHFVKQIEDTNESPYGLWQALTLNNDEVDPDQIKVNPEVLEKNRAITLQPGSGYWELIGTTSPQTTTKEIPHIIKTKWGQNHPWNEYVPYQYGSSGEKCPAGCTAIAGAQFLYYLHYKNNKPASTVTAATYNRASNTYTYSGSSSTIWNQMAKESDDNSEQRETAIFIGHVGKSINMEYTANGSRADLSDLAVFINKSGYNYAKKTIDYSYVQDQLEKDTPIVISAYRLDGNEKRGHSFIIDRYRDIKTTTTSTFGWIGTDNLGNDSNERDPDGNIVGYTFTYERETITTRSFMIGMNWGYNGSQDNYWFTSSSSADWTIFGDRNYNQIREILR